MNIRTFKLSRDCRMGHLEGVLKAVGERTFVTVMTVPFDGLVSGDHFYFSDKNNYDFSDESIVSRAEWNLYVLFEDATDILDNIQEYKEILESYDKYKAENDKKLSEAKEALKISTDQYDKKALEFYVEALSADTKHFYEGLYEQKKLHKVTIETLRQVIDYFSKTRK